MFENVWYWMVDGRVWVNWAYIWFAIVLILVAGALISWDSTDDLDFLPVVFTLFFGMILFGFGIVVAIIVGAMSMPLKLIVLAITIATVVPVVAYRLIKRVIDWVEN